MKILTHPKKTKKIRRRKARELLSLMSPKSE